MTNKSFETLKKQIISLTKSAKKKSEKQDINWKQRDELEYISDELSIALASFTIYEKE